MSFWYLIVHYSRQRAFLTSSEAGWKADGAKSGDDILIAHVLLSRIIIARQVWCMGCQGVRGAGVGGRGVVRFVVGVGRAAKFEADIIEAYRFNTR